MTGVAVLLLARGWSEVGPVAVSGVLLVLAWLVSPWFFPSSQNDVSARNEAHASGVPLIYWRPGCIHCLRLRLALGRTGNRAVWMDVSRDEDASARVRDTNDGDETVPTVFLRESAWVNPSPSWVRNQLRAS